MSDADRPMWPFPTDDAMDDAIGAWHSRPADAPPMTLHAWLGMSWETYAAWLKRSDLRAEAWAAEQAEHAEFCRMFGAVDVDAMLAELG